MPVMFAILLLLVAAYSLGAVSGSLLIGRLLGLADLRQSGSGNAGATNALRAGGKVYGLTVLLFDLGKGALAAALPWLLLSQAPVWLAYACAAAAVLGHVYPLYYGFRGGKGAATLIGALLVLAPWQFLPGLVVFIATLVLSGFVGLSILLGMTAVAAALVVSHWPQAGTAPVLFGLAMWVLMLYTHRGNIARMLAGSENRFERVMLLRRWS